MANLKRKLSVLMADHQESDMQNLEINLDNIIVDENQPRKRFDEEELESLAASIKQYGVISPIMVRELDGKYVIVVGERRFRAAKAVGLKTIPAVLLKNNDLTYETQLVENIVRENLTNDEIAAGILYLYEEKNYSKSEIANKLSKSNSYVSAYYSYASMDEQRREMLSEKSNDLTAILDYDKLLEKVKYNKDLHCELIDFIFDNDKITRKDVKMLEERVNEELEKIKNNNKNEKIVEEENENENCYDDCLEEEDKRLIKYNGELLITISPKYFKKVKDKQDFFEELRVLILKYR